MSNELGKPEVAPVRLAKRPSMAVEKSSGYRVSKAQSLRMHAYDKKVEAQETKKAKNEAQTAKAG